MELKQICYENTKHDVLWEIEYLCLTMRWITVSFPDHVPKVIFFTYEAITLFESKFDPRKAVNYEDRSKRIDSPLEELYRIMKNTSGHEMIKKVNTLTSKGNVFEQLHDVNS